MPNALSAATLPIYFGLRQASNNAGLLYGLVPKMFENNFIKPGTQQAAKVSSISIFHSHCECTYGGKNPGLGDGRTMKKT